MTTVFIFGFVLNLNTNLHQSVFYERDTITFIYNTLQYFTIFFTTILMTMISSKILMMPWAGFFSCMKLRLLYGSGL